MLIPNELKHKLPSLYSKQNEKDPIVELRFFNPYGMGAWFLMEYDPTENLAFGYVNLGSPELGYFSIDELESLPLPYGLKIERDLYFEPTSLSSIKKSLKCGA